jgi:translation initiation factor IF-3
LQFLSEGNKVFFVVRFRNREIQQMDIGVEILKNVLNKLSNIVIEKPISIKGREVTVLVSPSRQILDKIREKINIDKKFK